MAKTKIELPRVAPWFEDARAGERVDAVFATLTTELKNLKAADTSAVGGTEASSVGSSGVFYQTFESPITTWTKRVDDGTVTYPTNGQAGGKAFNSSGGESFYEFPEPLPFDPDRLYRIRCRVRQITSPTNPAKDLISVGVQGFASDRETVVDTSGGTDTDLAHWVCVKSENMGARTNGTWYTFTGYFSGRAATSTATSPSTDADAPRVLDEDVRYIAPCFRLNEVEGDGEQEIDFISLEVLTEGDESNQVLKDVMDRGSGVVNTNKVVPNSCNIPQLSDLTVDIGEVTTGRISGETVVIDLDDNLTNVITVRASSGGAVTFSVNKAGTIWPRGNLIVDGTSQLNQITNLAEFTRKLDVQPASGTTGLEYTPAGGGGVVVEIHDDGAGNGIVTTDFLFVHDDIDVTGNVQIDGNLTVTGTMPAVDSFDGTSFRFEAAADSVTFDDVGDAAATEQAWIEVTTDTGTGYIRVYATP